MTSCSYIFFINFENPSNSYFLHNGDHLGFILVTQLLIRKLVYQVVIDDDGAMDIE